MKKIILSTLMLILCVATYAQNPKRMTLPTLKFDEARLQQLDANARTMYADPADVNPFEEEQAERWRGKEWELMVLNYFLCVRSSQNQASDDGEVTKAYSDIEVEQVQSAMLDRYFQAKGIAVPTDLVERYNLVDKYINAIVEETEFLGDGNMWQINFYANTQYIFKTYLSQRLDRELRAASSDYSIELMEEEEAFRPYAEGIGDVFMNGCLAANDNLYYSMLPLDVACFGIEVEEFRVESLKRLSPMIGLGKFQVEEVPASLAVQYGADFNTVLADYSETLKKADVEKDVRKQWATALSETIQNLNGLLEKRDLIAAKLSEDSRKSFNTDSMYLVELIVRAMRGETLIEDDAE